MPRRAVLDSTILLSAFLTPGGAADVVLEQGIEEAFTCCLADEIIQETVHRLRSPRLQERYAYTAEDVDTFQATLRGAFLIVEDLPSLTGIVRDPNDDMILACGVAAGADYVVTRDDDLLSLGTYEGIAIVPPEAFLRLLRRAE
jgi:putative PIN family toxin of toxin-antitoxin system